MACTHYRCRHDLGLDAEPGVRERNLEETFEHTISFLSAMQSIPGDLSEAAAIDGAGVFKRFFKVTLPQLRSVSLVIVFIHIIWTAINFDFIWVMTEGGPNYATETLPLMIYRYSMKKFDVGAASALSTMMFTVMVVLFIFYYRKRSSLSADKSIHKKGKIQIAEKNTRDT